MSLLYISISITILQSNTDLVEQNPVNFVAEVSGMQKKKYYGNHISNVLCKIHFNNNCSHDFNRVKKTKSKVCDLI